MKRKMLRLGLLFLAFALTIAAFMTPFPAIAASCPPATCQNVAAACNGLGCAFTLHQIGTCTDGSGGNHNLYAAQCPACRIFTSCYI